MFFDGVVYTTIFFIIMFCVYVVSELTSVDQVCINSAKNMFEDHIINDIKHGDIKNGTMIFDYPHFNYPYGDIRDELILDTGEIVGTTLQGLIIGGKYRMDIYRSKYKINDIAWTRICDQILE